ncbi:flagellar hook assembly protein FlgD [Marinobacter bryozoorum]|jgi:flagellar basal-body rod modification protein FlgD|uniref:flagellar hook assembly protein FlgD n=1 Tax=Marinobacter bryozoorum TaxID=256324 RepID=UPI0020055F36|nr:flagellar hook assembly protein FlgD [Marinobacter bryozoorum]MCK7544658.1 flagellar hook assembly protein FlgD [Marinobacter bryozoorum]
MSIVNNTTSTADVLAEYRTKQESKGAGSEELGKNEFMELMIAQLKNQNPLEPKGNGEFIADLAQFSSLEEMQNLSSTVGDVVGEFRSSQALQASAMVGKSVLAPANFGTLGQDGVMKGVVNVPSSTGGLRINIENSSGETVRQLDLGQASAGQQAFTWDGEDGNGNPLPPDRYYVTAQGSYPQGTEQLQTLMSANVDSVSLGQGGSITLNLAGMGSIPLSEVQQVN